MGLFFSYEEPFIETYPKQPQDSTTSGFAICSLFWMVLEQSPQALEFQSTCCCDVFFGVTWTSPKKKRR